MKNDQYNTKEWVSPLLACVISESFFLKDTINTVFMQTTKKLTTYYGLWSLIFFIKTVTADSDLARILSNLAYRDIPK